MFSKQFLLKPILSSLCRWACYLESIKNHVTNHQSFFCIYNGKYCNLDERTFDFDNWDLDKDGILTGYEVNYVTFVLLTFIHWIRIHQVDSITHPLNRQTLSIYTLPWKNDSKWLKLKAKLINFPGLLFQFYFLFAVHKGSWNAFFPLPGWIRRPRDVSISNTIWTCNNFFVWGVVHSLIPRFVLHDYRFLVLNVTQFGSGKGITFAISYHK